MKYLALISALFLTTASFAESMSVSVGVESWQITGSLEKSNTIGHFVELQGTLPKAKEDVPAYFGLLWRSSSVAFSPEKADGLLTKDRNAKIFLTELGPNYCRPIIGKFKGCLSLGFVAGDLSQRSTTLNSFTGALARAGLKADVYKNYHLQLEAQSYQSREKLAGTILKLGGRGLALGLGTSF